MTITRWGIVLSIGVLCAGCAGFGRGPIENGPLPSLDSIPPPQPVSPGSLFSGGGPADLIGDFRARHVGDVLVVEITESSTGRTSADNNLERESAMKVAAPTVLGFEKGFNGALGKAFDPKLMVEGSGSKSFKGTGETTRANTLTGKIAVRVVAVGNGGQMVVAGSKRIRVNKEMQTLTLAGIVRPEDVQAGNTIASSSLADLTITYGGRGEVATTAREGWLQRLLTKIMPF